MSASNFNAKYGFAFTKPMWINTIDGCIFAIKERDSKGETGKIVMYTWRGYSADHLRTFFSSLVRANIRK